MSKMTVTLYKPNGSEIVFSNVSHAALDEKGFLLISPNDEEAKAYGHTVRTTLPFLMAEELDWVSQQVGFVSSGDS